MAGLPEEYFWPTLRDLYAADWRLPDSVTPAAFLWRVLNEGTTSNGIFGAKVHGIQFPSLAALLQDAMDADEPATTLLREAFPDLRLISLVRGDRAGQALSWYRALATDNWWHVEGANDLNREQSLTLDVHAVAGLERRLEHEEDRWRALFAATGVPVHHITYEELAEAYEPTLRDVLEFLAVEQPEEIEPPRLARQADSRTEQWRQQYESARRKAATAPPRPVDRRPASQAAPPVPTRDLAAILGRRRWRFSTRPYRHVVAQGVFTPAFYGELVAAFTAAAEGQALAYNPEHDFYGRPLLAGEGNPLGLFISEQWETLFSRLFGIATTGERTGALRRQLPGSRPGFPHNDIEPRHPGDTSQPVVRAIAIIFYLNNGPWGPGQGGQTGLYRHWSDPVTRSVKSVPPIDNSLLAFECSPYSYHSFMPNYRRRDSIVTFLHRTVDDFAVSWGFEGLQQYAGAIVLSPTGQTFRSQPFGAEVTFKPNASV